MGALAPGGRYLRSDGSAVFLSDGARMLAFGFLRYFSDDSTVSVFLTVSYYIGYIFTIGYFERYSQVKVGRGTKTRKRCKNQSNHAKAKNTSQNTSM
jgi:hypothetical protein